MSGSEEHRGEGGKCEGREKDERAMWCQQISCGASQRPLKATGRRARVRQINDSKDVDEVAVDHTVRPESRWGPCRDARVCRPDLLLWEKQGKKCGLMRGRSGMGMECGHQMAPSLRSLTVWGPYSHKYRYGAQP